MIRSKRFSYIPYEITADIKLKLGDSNITSVRGAYISKETQGTDTNYVSIKRFLYLEAYIDKQKNTHRLNQPHFSYN